MVNVEEDENENAKTGDVRCWDFFLAPVSCEVSLVLAFSLPKKLALPNKVCGVLILMDTSSGSCS